MLEAYPTGGIIISSNDQKLRDLPSVDELLRTPLLEQWQQRTRRDVVVRAAREAVDQQRRRLLSDNGAASKDASIEVIAQCAADALAGYTRPVLPPVVNATGIIIHTGLGRAPLAPIAVQAVAEAAGSYAPVEVDMATGERGSRQSLVAPMICQLTGAEAACVVNNNAAALVLTLAALARDRDVIVSRGELIEIGGGFRLPEIMAASGARLVEVGTTNRTRLSDYERAICGTTALLLKVHPSNYRISGFAEAPSVEALAALAERRQLPLVYDIGSGALGGAGQPQLPGEPEAVSSLASGADLVMFSGDKLLAGPQAGVVAGRADLVRKIQSHPLMRAFRVDKLTLAALGATLQIHLEPSRTSELPVVRMLQADAEELRTRAEAIVAKLESCSLSAQFAVAASEAFVGGGAVPQHALSSYVVKVHSPSVSETELARRLRIGSPAVLARVSDGAVLLDLRTVGPEGDPMILEALLAALADDRSNDA